MNLQIIEKWRITTDSHNFILEQKRIKGDKSKNAGEEYYSQVGFYVNLSGAFDGLLRHELLESDIQTVKELSELLQALRASIREVGDALTIERKE
jgi:hypothetical protein